MGNNALETMADYIVYMTENICDICDDMKEASTLYRKYSEIRAQDYNKIKDIFSEYSNSINKEALLNQAKTLLENVETSKKHISESTNKIKGTIFFLEKLEEYAKENLIKQNK